MSQPTVEAWSRGLSHKSAWALLAVMGLCVSPLSSWADGLTKTYAITGEAAPDANGLFSTFGIPRLNSDGQAAFWATLSDTNGTTSDDTGIFRGDGTAVLQLGREGQAAPDGNGLF